MFVNEESGEWKLGGVEYMTAVDMPYNLLPPIFQVYQLPEAKENAKPVTKWYSVYINFIEIYKHI